MLLDILINYYALRELICQDMVQLKLYFLVLKIARTSRYDNIAN